MLDPRGWQRLYKKTSEVANSHQMHVRYVSCRAFATNQPRTNHFCTAQAFAIAGGIRLDRTARCRGPAAAHAALGHGGRGLSKASGEG